MTVAPAATQVLCRQCSAPLPVETGSQFVTCSFCGTTNFVEKGRAVFHYALRLTLREDAAEAALRRWMAGNATVKNLDKKAVVGRPQFQYFPMWLIRTVGDGRERVHLQPAAALAISELKELDIPAGDLEPYDHSLDDVAHEVTVPYETSLRWLGDDRLASRSEVREVSLVHLPLYHFHYELDGRPYAALVDGATGRVFANIYPSKWEVPYVALGAAAFAAYFCAALVPLGGYLSGEGEGLLLGIVVYLVAAVVLAVPIFVAAAVVSARV